MPILMIVLTVLFASSSIFFISKYGLRKKDSVEFIRDEKIN